MNVYLILPDASRRALTPGPDRAAAEGVCPHCASDAFTVSGTGRRIASDDRAYEADAVARCCKRRVGLIRAEMDTLFGIEEDEAVLNGRPRVY